VPLDNIPRHLLLLPIADPAMHPTLRVALYGFGKFEHRALSSCFRWGARPGLALEQLQDLGSAQLIVANAEHPGAIEDLVAAGRASDAVFIGERAPDAAAARLARPIDALQVLRELDALSARRGISAPALPDLLPLPCGTAKARPPSVGFLSVDVPVPPASADQASPPASGPRALLVDDSEVALRFLQSRLHRLGLDTDLADGSARAGTAGAAQLRLRVHGRRTGGGQRARRVGLVPADQAPASTCARPCAGAGAGIGTP